MAAEDHLSPRLFHGTAAQLQPGDLIHPNHLGNAGHNQEHPEHSDFVWTTNRVRDADWYARHRSGAPTNSPKGAGKGHVYEVEPTGLHNAADLPLEPGSKSRTAQVHLAPVKVTREIPEEEREADRVVAKRRSV